MHKAGWLTIVLCLAVTAVARSQGTSDFRTWTDATGNYRLEAAFVSLADGQVVLLKQDQTKVEVPLEKLSSRDQALAKRLGAREARQAPAAEAPATAAPATDFTAAAAPKRYEWPQWRGPDRDGKSTETGLLDRWPDEGPRLLWKASGLGRGYSSVSVVGGRIYTLGNRGGTNLVALSDEDGSLLWTAPVGGGGDPNCTPTVEGDLVFGLSHGGDLLCANTATGDTVWKKNFGQDFGGRMMSGWGYSESPLVDGDRLVCTPGSDRAILAALNKRSGDVIWQTPMPAGSGSQGGDGAAYSSIVVSNGGGVRQYVQLVGRGVIGVEAQRGELLWGYNKIANGTANIPTPIVSGDYIFCSSGYGTGAALLELSGGRGRATAREVYFKQGRELQNHHGGMILIGDHVYMGHGHNEGFPVCIDLKTGRDAWRPGRGPGKGSAAVAYADGHLYFRYEDGTMALIEATPRSYNLKGTFRIPTNDRSWPHPVIANGRLYLRDQDDLLCYDIRK